jgi:hypothetical protein
MAGSSKQNVVVQFADVAHHSLSIDSKREDVFDAASLRSRGGNCQTPCVHSSLLP